MKNSPPVATVEVALRDRAYPILIGKSLLDNAPRIRQAMPDSRAVMVTNETIMPLYGDQFLKMLTASQPVISFVLG